MNSAVQHLNSLMPAASNRAVNNSFAATVLNKGTNALIPVANTANAANSGKFGSPLLWFVGFLVIFLVIFEFTTTATFRMLLGFMWDWGKSNWGITTLDFSASILLQVLGRRLTFREINVDLHSPLPTT